MKAGEKISLIDGKGNLYEGELTLVSDKKCEAKITSAPKVQVARPYYLHLAIAPTKQIDRIEWMVEKCVEIGIDEMSFIQCKNSERTAVKTDRIVKIVESAVKQSLQARIPKVNELQTLGKFISSANADVKLIAHCEDSEKTSLGKLDLKNKSLLVMIGPEGDFTHEEIEIAEKNGFKALSLGENRLRTETAGLYVCQGISVLVNSLE
jgi:16S rRNA (uracil1498-N3)-methyltransferase